MCKYVNTNCDKPYPKKVEGLKKTEPEKWDVRFRLNSEDWGGFNQVESRCGKSKRNLPGGGNNVPSPSGKKVYYIFEDSSASREQSEGEMPVSGGRWW